MPARYSAAGVAGIARNDVEITDFGLAVRHPVHVELAVHAKQEVARRIFPRLSLSVRTEHLKKDEQAKNKSAYYRSMLIDALRARLVDPTAASFRLMGEDLQLVTLAELRAALTAQEAAIPPELHAALVTEERELGTEAHAWLHKYNRSMHGRVEGYLELGRRCDFRYPWPVVAILGIVQVKAGMERARLHGLVGRVASKLGYERIEHLGDTSEDVLRRTNRAIFADSVPTVLRALRAESLRRAGQPALATALIEGRAALLWDAESARLCGAIADGLALADPAAQFRALAEATLRHFDREQAIFTHHISARSKRRKLPSAKTLPAPVVTGGTYLFSPLDIERSCINMVRGSHHGGAYVPAQLGAARPTPELSQFTTPVEGLFLCGASSHAGGSISGSPGYNCANVIAERLEVPRFWTPVLSPQWDG